MHEEALRGQENYASLRPHARTLRFRGLRQPLEITGFAQNEGVILHINDLGSSGVLFSNFMGKHSAEILSKSLSTRLCMSIRTESGRRAVRDMPLKPACPQP